MEGRGRTQEDGKGDGSGDRNKSSGGGGDGDGDGDTDGDVNGIEGGIGEAGGEGKRGTKSQKRCRCDMGNGRDLGVKRNILRQERVASVAADRDNLENSKKAGREARGTRGLSKSCTRK